MNQKGSKLMKSMPMLSIEEPCDQPQKESKLLKSMSMLSIDQPCDQPYNYNDLFHDGNNELYRHTYYIL